MITPCTADASRCNGALSLCLACDCLDTYAGSLGYFSSFCDDLFLAADLIPSSCINFRSSVVIVFQCFGCEWFDPVMPSRLCLTIVLEKNYFDSVSRQQFLRVALVHKDSGDKGCFLEYCFQALALAAKLMFPPAPAAREPHTRKNPPRSTGAVCAVGDLSYHYSFSFDCVLLYHHRCHLSQGR